MLGVGREMMLEQWGITESSLFLAHSPPSPPSVVCSSSQGLQEVFRSKQKHETIQTHCTDRATTAGFHPHILIQGRHPTVAVLQIFGDLGEFRDLGRMLAFLEGGVECQT